MTKNITTTKSGLYPCSVFLILNKTYNAPIAYLMIIKTPLIILSMRILQITDQSIGISSKDWGNQCKVACKANDPRPTKVIRRKSIEKGHSLVGLDLKNPTIPMAAINKELKALNGSAIHCVKR
jgi:hypothetical protein